MRDLPGCRGSCRQAARRFARFSRPFDVLEQQDTTIGRGAPIVELTGLNRRVTYS